VAPAKAQALLEAAVGDGRHHLTQDRSEQVLAAYGMPLLPGGLARSGEQAAEIAARIGCPVVMKVISEDIIHKVDVGGVVLGIPDEAAARRAYTAILAGVAGRKPQATIQGVLVQKMIAGGQEVILGLTHDPSFGPVVMFGLGGTFVEIFRDVSFRVAPVPAADVAAMIRQIKAYPILAGIRGRKPRDIAAIEACIGRLSLLATQCPQVRELDINPLIALDEGQGCFVADARIML
jgi:acyl-CoA synthetase (NDP forming)